jgi:hypothetical protein
VIAALLRDTIGPSARLRLKRIGEHRVANQAEAWRRARSAGSDYFIHGRFIPGADFTVIEVFLHSTGSGEQLTNLRVSRRGNRQMFEATVALAGMLEHAVPLVGRILRLSGDRVMVNLGKRHGLAPGNILSISGDAAFRSRLLSARQPAVRIEPVGEITIEQVDEVVAFGSVTARGSFDGVAQYQFVVPKPAARTNAGGTP